MSEKWKLMEFGNGQNNIPTNYGFRQAVETFIGSYFMKTEIIDSTSNNFIYKMIVMSFWSGDDSINEQSGGYPCIVNIFDTENEKFIKYLIRDFEEVIEHYQKQGYSFIKE
jgi:hypothetical protein